MWSIAAAAFVAIFFLRVPFPVIVFGALLLGFIGGQLWKEKFAVAHGHEIADDDGALVHADFGWARALRITAVCLALWWTPILIAGAWQGWRGAFFQEGVFFSKAAMITFGGAYAVLPYVAQQAVETFGWLRAEQMIDGLALAETTPGPLIMVLQFVGFMGGWNQPGALPPLLAATIGALITTWVTFVPCFLWILLGAPYVERLRGDARLTSALATVTAAVVGVILNLAVWFGLHVIFPAPRTVDWFALIVCAIAFLGMLRWRWEVVPVVIGSGVAGLIYRLAFWPAL
jgi:chromate transporter